MLNEHPASCDYQHVAFVLTAANRMLCSRRTLLVFVVGLLFGYTLMYVIFRPLYSRSNASLRYTVPSAPHSHDEMNQYIPTLHDVQQWHDFNEESHTSSLTFTFMYKLELSIFTVNPAVLVYSCQPYLQCIMVYCCQNRLYTFPKEDFEHF